MMFSRLLAAALVSISLLRPALAADAVFPPGVRIGLAPLVGLSKAKTFTGFETEDQSVKVLLTELPAGAYGEVKNAFTANPGGPARSSRRASRHRPGRPTTRSRTDGTARRRCGAIR
ncbi:exported protein of unknown function (N-terminal fragment) [Bradyrhizobium sp. ORS 285]|nr:exported protein of unknown function (N-terminal fragment) [Bradyrhizobium sp. ORS 285]